MSPEILIIVLHVAYIFSTALWPNCKRKPKKVYQLEPFG